MTKNHLCKANFRHLPPGTSTPRVSRPQQEGFGAWGGGYIPDL
jgi:hypothetical protein